MNILKELGQKNLAAIGLVASRKIVQTTLPIFRDDPDFIDLSLIGNGLTVASTAVESKTGSNILALFGQAYMTLAGENAVKKITQMLESGEIDTADLIGLEANLQEALTQELNAAQNDPNRRYSGQQSNQIVNPIGTYPDGNDIAVNQPVNTKPTTETKIDPHVCGLCNKAIEKNKRGKSLKITSAMVGESVSPVLAGLVDHTICPQCKNEFTKLTNLEADVIKKETENVSKRSQLNELAEEIEQLEARLTETEAIVAPIAEDNPAREFFVQGLEDIRTSIQNKRQLAVNTQTNINNNNQFKIDAFAKLGIEI